MLAVRALLFNVLFFTATTVLSISYVPLMALPRPVLIRAVEFWSWVILFLLRHVVGLRYELRGEEHLTGDSVLVASKHQSAWETISFCALLQGPAIVLKKELLRIPIWGWLAWRCGNIRVDREAGAKALRVMVDDAMLALAERRPIVIFPQGTRTPPGTRRPYLPGVAALYGSLGVPVVPVALNSGLFWGRRSFLKRPGTITVEFLPPIPPGLKRRQFMRELEECIETATRRLEQEAVNKFDVLLPEAEQPAQAD